MSRSKMLLLELSVFAVPSFRPRSTGGIVRHSTDVATPRYVGFMSGFAARREKDHLVHVLIHQPFVAVDGELHEPSKTILTTDLR